MNHFPITIKNLWCKYTDTKCTGSDASLPVSLPLIECIDALHFDIVMVFQTLVSLHVPGSTCSRGVWLESGFVYMLPGGVPVRTG